MAITHNQINLFWKKSANYKSFIRSGFSKGVLDQSQAMDFLKTGAYIIMEGKKLSRILIPWDQNRRFEILSYPRLSNAYISLGAEYLFKGVFLHNGYSINKPKRDITLTHPIPLKGNKNKLSLGSFQDLAYVTAHIYKLVNFQDFDASQKQKENLAKLGLRGQKLHGITKMTIPYPTAKQLVDYIHFKRNQSLHRPFIIPEFGGITDQEFEFLDYVAQRGTGQGINDLGKLS